MTPEMDRRHFVRSLAIGGAVLSLGAAVWPKALRATPGAKIDIGTCKSVSVTCISETGWHDTARLLADIKANGGSAVSQWQSAWDPGNGAGSCSLLEVEGIDGTRRKYLIDAGWNPDYMARRFAATGVDAMLRAGEIEALFVSHEHLDHLWGLETVLRLRPDITIMVPATFHREGEQFIQGATFEKPGCKNAIRHAGKLVRHAPGGIHPLAPGLAAATFDLPIILGVDGEQSLYANVAGKGIVCITGCCHQTITRFADYARENLAGADKLHGLYGGLHIAPFGPLKPEQEALITAMGGYGFEKIACNHCTGLPAVEMMTKLGYPVVRGSGRDGSASDLYVGNGDTVRFG